MKSACTLLAATTILATNAFAAEKMVSITCSNVSGRIRVETLQPLVSDGEGDLKIVDSVKSHTYSFNSRDNEFFGLLRNNFGDLVARDGAKVWPNQVLLRVDTVSMKAVLRHEAIEAGNPVELSCNYRVQE